MKCKFRITAPLRCIFHFFNFAVTVSAIAKLCCQHLCLMLPLLMWRSWTSVQCYWNTEVWRKLPIDKWGLDLQMWFLKPLSSWRLESIVVLLPKEMLSLSILLLNLPERWTLVNSPPWGSEDGAVPPLPQECPDCFDKAEVPLVYRVKMQLYFKTQALEEVNR